VQALLVELRKTMKTTTGPFFRVRQVAKSKLIGIVVASIFTG